MKKMKKVMALALSFMMVVAMSVATFATETVSTYTLTITGTKSGHTYNVYQIFTGEISDLNGKKVLSNVKYGESYVPTGKTVGEAVDKAVLEEITDADTFAQNFDMTNPVYKTVASTANQTVIDGLPAGYYLVKDGTAITGQDAVTKFILQVVGNTSVAVKSDVPTVEKKVQENVKTVNGNTDTRIPNYTLDPRYNDVADYNIGDDVPFQLIGTLPSNYADYTTYKYIFHDTLSSGLTYNNDAKIYVKNGSTKTEIKEGFNTTCVNGILTISTDNLKAVKDASGNVINTTAQSYIIVEYTAKLNSAAQIGLPGNPNEVYLEFSNNPNNGGEGETGTTPADKVIVFTYELDVTKVDRADATKKLKDAEFKLHNKEGLWVKVDAEGKVTSWTDKESEASTLKSDEKGLFKVIGLDAGVYYLKETKAPQHYDLLKEEIELTIVATTANNQAWEGKEPEEALTNLGILVGNATEVTPGNTNSGSVSMNVENSQGSTLPTTGGMGTTIFYVVGSILVLGAAILLITKKRMSAR